MSRFTAAIRARDFGILSGRGVAWPLDTAIAAPLTGTGTVRCRRSDTPRATVPTIVPTARTIFARNAAKYASPKGRRAMLVGEYSPGARVGAL